MKGDINMIETILAKCNERYEKPECGGSVWVVRMRRIVPEIAKYVWIIYIINHMHQMEHLKENMIVFIWQMCMLVSILIVIHLK